MLNYAVDPDILGQHVPPGTELDSYDGVFYVSMVGFQFLRTRVLGVPIPGHRNFEEVNLRFYVKRGERRGVVFLKEIVPKYAITVMARWLYNENYITLPTSHRLEAHRVEYGWRYRDSWNYLRVEVAGEAAPASPGSLEEFITEHHWGYTKQRDGGCLEYYVEHVPWLVRKACSAQLSCDARNLYGPEFAEALGGPPKSAFLAEGSPVVVSRGVRI